MPEKVATTATRTPLWIATGLLLIALGAKSALTQEPTGRTDLEAFQPAQLTAEDYARAERLLYWNDKKLIFNAAVRPQWIGKSDRFWYRVATRNGKEFILVDPDRNSREPAFDHTRIAAALSRASGTAVEADKLPFDRFAFAADGSAIEFDLDKDHWACKLGNVECSKTGSVKPPSPADLPSPDGNWAAFVKNHNLYVRNLAKGEEVQLTTDGEPYYDYASSSDSSTSAVSVRLSGRPVPPVAAWSPDSKKLVTYRLDQRKVKELYLVQSVPAEGVRPVAHSYRYPMPGDKDVAQAELMVFDVVQKTREVLKTEPLPITFLTPIQLHRVWWSDDASKIYFLCADRGWRTLTLRVADAQTGAARTIIEEHGATFVEPNPMISNRPLVKVLKTSPEVVWYSERDGWGHLYLFDANTGQLKNQITAGSWRVRDILHLDEVNRWIYFTASGREQGRDPYLRHVYRIKLDGTGLQLLTPEDAEHQGPATREDPSTFLSFSPSGRYFVDTYARADQAPIAALRSADGKLIRELERADISELLRLGWKYPERFQVKANDGVTDLYGLIYRPSFLDPTKKYPVLDSIYPGPQVIRTPKFFGLDSLGAAESMAELGFIVVTIDGRGTPLRSKELLNLSYGHLGAAGGLEDHVAGLRQLATRYPQMDLNRVGIYGVSGGGYATARAMVLFPDFYKVAVAASGNYDSRAYLAGWGEPYEGWPDDKNYLEQAIAPLAGNLKGKLLLAHGEMDDNVHPALALQVVDSLIKANKDFDLLILPNQGHAITTHSYFIRRQWDFFVKNLLGAEPPKDYKVSPRPPL